MLIISHRGNLNGRVDSHENDPEYILDALIYGFDVEIDLWYHKDKLYLGHDKPQHKISEGFLQDPRLWIHCKNLEAAQYLSLESRLNYFLHTKDVIVTTQGFLWSAPGERITPRSIAVMPELAHGWDISKAFGVCTDFPLRYK